MKQIFLFLATLCLINSAVAQHQEQYSRAKIYLDADKHTILDLAALGLAVDHGDQKKDTWFISDFSASEIQRARSAGFKVDILIEDVSKYYREQNKKKGLAKTTLVSCDEPAIPTPAHFHLGTYAGFFTYNELLSILDSMRLLYPNLISVKQPISTFLTHENRPIYWLRVSNNPSVSQPAKPQILYTALHHAREPGSISQMVFFLWHLLENYNTDPQIKAIVDNAELYFIPCINPDGYILNETNDPWGGGMWRKNRRDNMDGSVGVDLNRNYGYFWGLDNVGSSPNSFTDVYRGPSGFSEPETQAVKWFSEQHDFKICLNYHTHQNTLIYPWGYAGSLYTPDSFTYSNYARKLTEHNHYQYGTCNEVLWYVTNGTSDDWMYGDLTNKSKILAMTPEVGSKINGFYPPASEIIPDCERNLPANINAAALLLPFADIATTDRKVITQASGFLHYRLQSLGLPNTSSYTVSIVPLDNWLTVSATPKVHNNLTMLQEVTDSISYSLLPSTPNHQLIRYILRANNGIYDQDDTVEFYYGKYYALHTRGTNSLNDWINAGWGLSNEYFSAPHSIQSSFDGSSNYNDMDNPSISTAAPIDLTKAKEAYLYYYTKWFVETNNDIVTVNASEAGFGNWQPLCGKHTSEKYEQFSFSTIPLYDGIKHEWVREEINLGDYLGKKIDIQFQLLSDQAINYKGFYFDDVVVVTVQDSILSVTSLNGNSDLLNVYPNPAGDILNIALKDNNVKHPLSAGLYDCLGREVMNFQIDRQDVTLDVSQLPSNVYYLKVLDEGKVLTIQKVNVLH